MTTITDFAATLSDITGVTIPSTAARAVAEAMIVELRRQDAHALADDLQLTVLALYDTDFRAWVREATA